MNSRYRKMHRVTVTVPNALHSKMQKYGKHLDYSKIFCEAVGEKIKNYKKNLPEIIEFKQKRAELTETIKDIDNKLLKFH